MVSVALLAVLGVLVAPQRLDPPAKVSHPGTEVEARAVDTAGAPLRGVSVEVVPPSGKSSKHVTDDTGAVRFTPREVGAFELRMSVPNGPRVFAVHHVAALPTRWLYALFLVPIGLLLVVMHARRLRELSRS